MGEERDSACYRPSAQSYYLLLCVVLTVVQLRYAMLAGGSEFFFSLQETYKLESRLLSLKADDLSTKDAKSNHDLPRVLAIYFPQFHQDPLNDKLWGEGFTDWNSLKNAPYKNRLGYPIPRPVGHPDALGYYDLTDSRIRKRQGELAKKHGVDGFIYHHYWFYDPKLPGASLSKPLENMLHDGHPDMPFFFNWCTVSWVNVWFDRTQSEQQASNETKQERRFLQRQFWRASNDQIKAHWQWLVQFFRHPNYIRVDNQPVLMTYAYFPEADRILEKLRILAIQDGFDGLYFIVGRSAMPSQLYKPPQVIPRHLRLQMMRMQRRKDLIGPNHTEHSPTYNTSMTYPYPLPYMTNTFTIPQWCFEKNSTLRNSIFAHSTRPEITGIVAAFDNTPRRQLEDATIFMPQSANQTLERFRRNLLSALYFENCCGPRDLNGNSSKVSDRFVAVNAWNEWGEGMVLEPSDVYGTGFLEVIRQVKEQVMQLGCNYNSRQLPHELSQIVSNNTLFDRMSGDEIVDYLKREM